MSTMDKSLIELARKNRKNPTEAESIMWEFLRNHFYGLHFRRQFPISGYIADFICRKKKLIIELDGGYHFSEGQIKRDKERTATFNSLGYSVIRFTNEEVVCDTTDALQRIKDFITKELPYDYNEQK